MVGSWVSSHESEVDVIVYIVYAAVLLSSSVLYCTVQCPYVVIREVDYVTLECNCLLIHLGIL